MLNRSVAMRWWHGGDRQIEAPSPFAEGLKVVYFQGDGCDRNRRSAFKSKGTPIKLFSKGTGHHAPGRTWIEWGRA